MKKNILFFVAMLLPAWGCAPTVSSKPVPQLYHPGQNFLLVFRSKMLDEGIGCTTTIHVSSVTVGEGGNSDTVKERVIERKETKRWSKDWTEVELSLTVAASNKPSCVAISMKYRRYRGGHSFRDEDGHTSKESFDSAKTPPAGDDKREYEEGLKAMRTVFFSALVNTAGKIVEFDAKGEEFDSLKKVCFENNKTSKKQKQFAFRMRLRGIFCALADTMAYLPPVDVQQGQQWQVRREKVFPYRMYAFYMFTYGCAFSTEQSTCLVKSIKQTPAGRVATIGITGRRIPGYLSESGMSKRVERLDISGKLLFNLDAENIIDLQIESIPRFLSAEDKRMFKIKFVNSVKLRPLER